MYITVFITCANKREARKVAKRLVEEREAACVNIIDKIESIFWWQGRLDRAKETLLVVKSKKERFSRIIKLVRSLHSYSVPEIIAFDITKGNRDYLNWLNESIRKPT